jgi:hypothetical protein
MTERKTARATDAPVSPRPATPAEQVAYNDAKRQALAAGEEPPDPPEGIIFDTTLPE